MKLILSILFGVLSLAPLSVLADTGFNCTYVVLTQISTGVHVHCGTPTSTPAPVALATSAPTPKPSSTPINSALIAPAGTQPFPGSIFNNSIVNPVISANSSTMIAHALAGYNTIGKFQVSTHPLSTGPTDGNIPVYTSHNTDPAYKIHCKYYSNCPLEGYIVHIPKGAIPEGNLGYKTFTDDGHDDQHLAIRNLDTKMEADMWLTPLPSGIGGTLNIGYGGLFPFSSGGFGHLGATAAGFALAQGRVRPIDILNDHLPTALFLVTPCENKHIYPAVGDDGGTTAGCPPIGALVWLDSSDAAVDASGSAPSVKVVLKALHEFGGYIGDRCTYCSLTVAPEGGLAYQAYSLPNPWAQIIARDFPTATTSGTANEYHIPLSAGNINLSQHLHIINGPSTTALTRMVLLKNKRL